MSGLEVLAGIDACITIVDAVRDIIHAFRSSEEFSEKLNGVNDETQLIAELLQAAKSCVRGEEDCDQGHTTAARAIVQDTEKQLMKVKDLLGRLSNTGGGPSTKRIFTAIRNQLGGVEPKIEKILYRIRKNLNLLQQKQINQIGTALTGTDRSASPSRKIGGEQAVKAPVTQNVTGQGHAVAAGDGNFLLAGPGGRQVAHSGGYQESRPNTS